MKKGLALFLISTLLVAALTACGNTNVQPSLPEETIPPGTASSENTSETVSSPDPDDPEDLTTDSPLDPSTPPLIEIDPTEEPYHIAPLSAEIENQVKQTYLDSLLKQEAYEGTTLDDVIVVKYYGTYNGAVVIMLTDRFTNYTDALWSETIQNTVIYYTNGNNIKVWKDGAFCRLQEAYDKGILTEESIAHIASIQNENKVFGY